jgi:hypothetical protein
MSTTVTKNSQSKKRSYPASPDENQPSIQSIINNNQSSKMNNDDDDDDDDEDSDDIKNENLDNSMKNDNTIDEDEDEDEENRDVYIIEDSPKTDSNINSINNNNITKRQTNQNEFLETASKAQSKITIVPIKDTHLYSSNYTSNFSDNLAPKSTMPSNILRTEMSKVLDNNKTPPLSVVYQSSQIEDSVTICDNRSDHSFTRRRNSIKTNNYIDKYETNITSRDFYKKKSSKNDNIKSIFSILKSNSRSLWTIISLIIIIFLIITKVCLLKFHHYIF